MGSGKPFILVICGPPSSGKSFLMRALAAERKDIKYHEMDEIRREILPGTLHDKPTRSAAYRVMHFRATRDLLEGYPVALSATYMPPEHRAEIAALALRLRLPPFGASRDVPLFVVQCVCTPDRAVNRFQQREPGHAGTDLTVMRVRQLSAEYERFDGALLIDTESSAHEVDAINSYIGNGVSVDPIAWARHPYATNPSVQHSERLLGPSLPKLSEASVKRAKRWLLIYAIGWTILTILTALGVIPFVYKICERVHRAYAFSSNQSGPLLRAAKAIPAAVKAFWAQIPNHGLGDWAEWGTFCLALAGLASIVLAIKYGMEKSAKEAERVKTAGDTPRYATVTEAIPSSDKEIYHAYFCRIAPDRMPFMPIPNVPILYQLLPVRNRSFSALVRSSQNQVYSLPHEAAEFGLDWNGFVTWRQKERREEYAMTYSHEYGLRCVGFQDRTSDGTCMVDAVKCTYDEYVCTELAVNYCAPGSLPDMRRLFEGKSWDIGNQDLSNVAESAKRYSMRVNVTGLVLTEDDYFILQRRSAVVGHGLGSLAGAVNGAADYYADCCDDESRMWLLLGKVYAALPYSFHEQISKIELDGPRRWDLAKSALREVREEIGLLDTVLYESDQEEHGVPPFKQPFIAAAYNLRYGRDLNFYCCFRTLLKSDRSVLNGRTPAIDGKSRIWFFCIAMK